MAEAKRDENRVPTLLAVSTVDGVTPVELWADPTTHRLLVDLPGGTGDVTGPASATDNAIARFDGVTGKIIQNSGVIIDDSDNVTGITSLTIDGATGNTLAVDTSTLIVDATNNRVGVGQTTPDTIFHVYENNTNTGTGAGITLEQDGAGDASMVFELTGLQTYIVGADNSDSDTFKISPNNFGTTGIVMDSSANVGIGISAPTQLLHVQGIASGSTDPLFLVEDTDTTNGREIMEVRTAAASGSLRFSNDNEFWRWFIGSTGEMRFDSNDGVGKFYISNTGSVGINDTAPDYRLEVVGSVTNGYFGVTNTTDGDIFEIDSNGDVGIGTNAPAVRLHVEEDDATNNAVTQIARLTHTTSGTPTAGIGTGLEFETETSASNNEIGATIEAVTTDVTAAAEDFDLIFNLMEGGAAATEKMRISSAGALTGISSLTTLGVITGATLEATGDTATGDDAAIGYTATEGIIITGQGSTDDVTIKNDADASVLTVPTGTTDVEFQGAAIFDAEVDNGNSGTADTIDWTAGNKQRSTLTGNVTYTFTEPNGPCNLIFKLVQDATGSRTATWPADVNWPGGTAPTLTTTANAVDIVSFYYDGTDFYGQVGLDFS